MLTACSGKASRVTRRALRICVSPVQIRLSADQLLTVSCPAAQNKTYMRPSPPPQQQHHDSLDLILSSSK